jgi:hypothetical protein
LEADSSLDFSLRHLEADSSLDFSLRHLEADSSLDFSLRHLEAVNSLDSRQVEAEDNKAARHPHHRQHSHHKNHLLYSQLILERLEAASSVLPTFG